MPNDAAPIDAVIDAVIDADRRKPGGGAAWAAPIASFPPAKPGGNDARSAPAARAATPPTDAPIDATDAPRAPSLSAPWGGEGWGEVGDSRRSTIAARRTPPHPDPLPPKGAEREVDAATVITRLEEAGRTLLALPHSGPSPKLRVSVWEVLNSAIEGYGWEATRLRPAVPDAARIGRMDEAFGWLALIPREKYVLRRIVGLRALVHPLTGRHLYPWRRLGAALGADHKAVQRWHGQGVGLIVAGVGGIAAAGVTEPNGVRRVAMGTGSGSSFARRGKR